MLIIIKNGQAEDLNTATYQTAVNQMIDVLEEFDEAGAAAWYIRFYEQFQAAGLSYGNFMHTVRVKINIRDLNKKGGVQ